MDAEKIEIAPGRNRAFSFTLPTENPDEIWSLWTDPATWGSWDRGLKTARLEGKMRLGSRGAIEPLTGPEATFEVTEFQPNAYYTFETKLPGAVLRVNRAFNADRTEFTHTVSFVGLSAFVFASMFGPEFRKALPPTMRELKALSEV